MSATVLKFVTGNINSEAKEDKALKLMEEYFQVFDIECLEDRQEAYAIWHTKAMLEKVKR